MSLLLTSCGNTKVAVSDAPSFRYFVESKFTGQVENTLVIEGSDLGQMTYKLNGRGFTADIPLDTEMPIKARTKLQYLEVGDYSAKVQFFKADGSPLLEDTLKWSFSLDAPQNPILGFASDATNDSHVVLLISESRDPHTNEIWVEGDLAAEDNPEGSWRAIPSFSKVPLQLTDPDGMKTLRVKLRNDFKNETAAKTIHILKKTTAPSQCRVAVRSSGTVNRYFEIMLFAEDQGPVFARVFGDAVEPSGFFEFKGSGTHVPIKLTSGAGSKTLTVQIRDNAENYCLRQDISLKSDPSYVGEGIRLADSARWTDSDQVKVLPWIDHFDDDLVEMYIHGDVLDDANTFQWVPYKPEMMVSLQPNDGTRWIRVQYRVNGELTSFRAVSVYLKPSVIILSGTDTPYHVVASNINELAHLTLKGCVESYEQVAYASSFKCTPAAPAATITYTLKDGSTVSKSSPFPP